MNYFISLKLCDGGTVAIRPESIDAVVAHVDIVTVHAGGRAYEVEPGQMTLNMLGEHCSHAGVRVA